MKSDIVKHAMVFEKMSNLERRRLLVGVIKERAGVGCEFKIYEAIPRVEYLMREKRYDARRHQIDKDILKVFLDLKLPAGKLRYWFDQSKKSGFKYDKAECESCIFNDVCEVRNREKLRNVKDQFECFMVIKKLKEFLLKKDAFMKFVNSSVFLTDEEVMEGLRKVYIDEHWNIEIEYSENDLKVKELLKEYGIYHETALRWLYIAREYRSVFEDAVANKIAFEEIFECAERSMRREVKKQARPLRKKWRKDSLAKSFENFEKEISKGGN